jgi:hypothetical protein
LLKIKIIVDIINFDFDGTIADSPMSDEGKIIWKNKTGEDYPHNGWWGRKESLNDEVFDVKGFSSVINLIKSENRKPNTYNVMLTSRIPRVSDSVQFLLKKFGLEFDSLSFKSGGSSEKDERILDYLSKFPEGSIKEINVYDDREKEFKVFRSLKPKLDDMGIKFNIYRVDEGKISLLEHNLRDIVSEEISIYIKNNL